MVHKTQPLMHMFRPIFQHLSSNYSWGNGVYVVSSKSDLYHTLAIAVQSTIPSYNETHWYGAVAPFTNMD